MAAGWEYKSVQLKAAGSVDIRTDKTWLEEMVEQTCNDLDADGYEVISIQMIVSGGDTDGALITGRRRQT